MFRRPQLTISDFQNKKLDTFEVKAENLKRGQLVEIKDLLYFGDAWDNKDGYATITKVYPRANMIDVTFINNFTKYSKCGVHIEDIIRLTPFNNNGKT